MILQDVAVCGFIGAAIHVCIKARELKVTSAKHNIEFKFREYFLGDWLSHTISILFIVFYLYLINRRVHVMTTNMYEILLVVSATVGYSGDHLASYLFSSVTKRIERAIDHKTSYADSQAGTTDKPTPK